MLGKFSPYVNMIIWRYRNTLCLCCILSDTFLYIVQKQLPLYLVKLQFWILNSSYMLQNVHLKISRPCFVSYHTCTVCSSTFSYVFMCLLNIKFKMLHSLAYRKFIQDSYSYITLFSIRVMRINKLWLLTTYVSKCVSVTCFANPWFATENITD